MVQLAINLDGGIGNLLFQYSAALALQNRFGYEVSFIEVTPGLNNRLETYIGKNEFATSECPSNAKRPSRSKQRLITDRPLSRLAHKAIVNRLTTKWTPEFSRCEAPFTKRVRYVKGYFQHPSWFTESKDLVLKKLDSNLKVLENRAPENLTSIHLRRSDYVRLGWDLPLSYYEKAIAFDEKIKRGPVAIFSDDRIVSKLFEERLLAAGINVHQRESMDHQSALNDFVTISNSSRIVMSNSTFSWWAASLARYSDPLVKIYCPSTWLPTAGSEILIDPSWIQIS
jgi:hypothetical protein